MTIYSFSDAQAKAREWWKAASAASLRPFAPADGPYTVADALEAYFCRSRTARLEGAWPRTAPPRDARILPALGDGRTGEAHDEAHSRLAIGLATAAKLIRVARRGAQESKSSPST